MLTSRSVLQVLQWVWQHSEEDSTFYGPYGIEQARSYMAYGLVWHKPVLDGVQIAFLLLLLRLLLLLLFYECNYN